VNISSIKYEWKQNFAIRRYFQKAELARKKPLLFPTRESVFSFAGITLYRMYVARYAFFLFLISFFFF